MEKKSGLNISAKTFIGTVALLVGIMILAGVLTRIIPQGSYQYQQVDGRSVVIPGTYEVAEDKTLLPVWRWFTAPFEVLGTSQAVTAGMIMLFILLIGGSFLVLESAGILSYMIRSIISRFEGRKYTLLAIITLVCMVLGSTMGLFEETVTLVPITVALALMLGWDSLTGIGMSILAVGFGFSAGTLNPFTIGVTQKLADLPMFSGVLLRVLLFCAIYGLLVLFLTRYAKKIEKNPEKSMMYSLDEQARKRYQGELSRPEGDTGAKKRALFIFVGFLILVFAYILVAFFVSGLGDYAMPVMALCFTGGALAAGKISGFKGGLMKTFFKGMISIAPSVLLILLAMSVTYIMSQGGIIDTILNFFYTQMSGLGPYGGALVIFALVLLMDFFIGGAAAKAFLLIPIIIPLADMVGITRQTAIQAFALGDGFTNMLYPTNVVLIITLGMIGVPYGKWLRWTWKIQLAFVAVSAIVLTIAVKIGYGPY